MYFLAYFLCFVSTLSVPQFYFSAVPLFLFFVTCYSGCFVFFIDISPILNSFLTFPSFSFSLFISSFLLSVIYSGSFIFTPCSPCLFLPPFTHPSSGNLILNSYLPFFFFHSHFLRISHFFLSFVIFPS